MLLQPRPFLAINDVAHVRLVYAEIGGDLFPRHRPFHDSNHANFGFGKFGIAAALASVVSAVKEFVGPVFDRSSPSEVLRAHAPTIPIAATVRGFVCGCWRWTVQFGANKAGHKKGAAAFSMHHTVPASIPTEWPQQTFIFTEWQNNVSKESLGFVPAGTASQGVTMATPTLVVRHAPTACAGALAAVRNAAYLLISHLRIPFIRTWSEHVVRGKSGDMLAKYALFG